MKRTNKFLAIILAIMMVISIIPLTASATTYSGTCGDNVTWTYDSSTYTLTISGTGDMYDYKTNNRPWESYEDSIKEVVVEDGVTTIGNYAFYHCGKLITVTLPDSVTTIGEYGFRDCRKLKSINIPDGITTIGVETFTFCESITNITIPNSVTIIGESAFYACYGLTEITIPDSVTTIDEDAFSSCRGLTNVSIGKGVTTINGRAFAYCDNLTNIAIPKNVTAIEETAFAECKSLSSITVDSDSEYFVNDEYGVLFNKNKTMLIQYPTGNTEKCYTIPNSVTTLCAESFDSCLNLESVTIPVSVTTIGHRAFSYYKQTIKLYYSGTSNQWNEMLGNNADTADFLANNYVIHCIDKTLYPSGACGDNLAWSYDTHSNTLTISGTGTMYNYEYDELSGFGFYPWVVFAYDVEHVIIKDGAMSIGTCAFTDCKYLTDIELNDSVTSIGDEAFRFCPKLTDIYYTGTEDQWETISIGKYNSSLLNSTIHYNYHMHKYTPVITEPTCTEQGYTTYTCECGDTYVDDYVDAAGHTPADAVEENYVAPTCTENGSKDIVVYCSVCDEEISREIVVIEKIEHALTEYERVLSAPTCTENGSKEVVSYCVECNTGISRETVTLPALGHTNTAIVEENYIVPTCTETGSVDKATYCSVCGEEISRETVVLDATGHADNNGDGYCDADNELLDPSVECDHSCHKDRILGFFWKIINFFNKLFGLNKLCECGVAHY